MKKHSSDSNRAFYNGDKTPAFSHSFCFHTDRESPTAILYLRDYSKEVLFG